MLDNPLVLMAGLMLVGLLAVVFALPYGRWLVLGVVLFTSSLALPTEYDTRLIFYPDHPNLIAPLHRMKDSNRLILAGVMGFLAAFVAAGQVQGFRPAAGPGVAAFLACLGFQAVIVLKHLALGITGTGVGYAAIFAANVVLYVFGVCRWLRNARDVVWAVRAVGISVGLFLAFSLAQVPFNWYALMSHHGRFEGPTGNAQHAGVFAAASLPLLFFLARRRSEPILARATWAVLLGLLALVLLLTRSRTGLTMLFVEAAFLLRKQKQFLILLAPAIFAPVLLVSRDSEANQVMGGRGDTRSDAWLRMWEGFLEDPIFGSEEFTQTLVYGEHSWLAMAHTTGVVGLTALMIAAAIVAHLGWQVSALRFRPDDEMRQVREVVVAVLIGYAWSSLFEAVLLGAMSHPVYMIYLQLALANFLLVRSRQMPPAPTGSCRRNGLSVPAATRVTHDG